MKKIIVLVMAAVMMFGTACGNNDNKAEKNNNKSAIVDNNGNKNEENSNKSEEDGDTSEGTDKEEEQSEEKEKKNVTKLQADKLLEEGKFKYNESLKFSSGNKYKYSELSQSQGVSEEEGFEFEGDFYGDRYSVVNTILNFNDAWISYINNGDNMVKSLVVKGSEAEKDVLEFNRDGLKERFLLLEIGDVRKVEIDGETFFYVWVHEKIEEDRSGSIKIREYNWIYKLKKSEMDLMVDSFTRDTNL